MSSVVSGALNFIRSWCYGNAKPAEKKQLQEKFDIVSAALEQRTQQAAQTVIPRTQEQPLTKTEVEKKLKSLKEKIEKITNPDEGSLELKKSVKARIMQVAQGNQALVAQVAKEIPGLERQLQQYNV